MDQFKICPYCHEGEPIRTGTYALCAKHDKKSPNPDDVRRALDRMRDQGPRLYSFERVVREAAEAWLREHGGQK